MQYKAICELTGVLYSKTYLINNQTKNHSFEWQVIEEFLTFYFSISCSLIIFIASLTCSGFPVITNFILSLFSACFLPDLNKNQL
nr:MAG TPA: hypothetical protein [Caudoviricetes sp.]